MAKMYQPYTVFDKVNLQNPSLMTQILAGDFDMFEALLLVGNCPRPTISIANPLCKIPDHKPTHLDQAEL